MTIKCDVEKFSEINLSELKDIRWFARRKHQRGKTVISKYSNRKVVIGPSFTGRVELVNVTSLKISRLQTRDEMEYYCYVQLINNYGYGPFNQLKVNC